VITDTSWLCGYFMHFLQKAHNEFKILYTTGMEPAINRTSWCEEYRLWSSALCISFILLCLISPYHPLLYPVEIQPTFRRNMSPPSSGSKNMRSKKPTWKQVANRRFCETSIDFQPTTWRYIREDRTIHNHLWQNLNSCMPSVFLTVELSFRNS
jgi:hypothetical protein